MSLTFLATFVEFEVFIGCGTTIMGQFDVVDILDNLGVADKFDIVFNEMMLSRILTILG